MKLSFSKLAILICLMAYSVNVFSEVVFDGTIGPVPPGFSLAGDMTILEGYGELKGQNLFHSFDIFNIRSGESVTFSGNLSIANIFARVTGNNISTINGLLSSTTPFVDLWLINPAGFVFGDNASLDIQGSLHVSTADYINFSFTDNFYAGDHYPDTILSALEPQAWGFIDSIGSIDVGISGGNTTSLSLNAGETLSFIGGDVTFTDALVQVLGGRLNIASAKAGSVDLNAVLDPLFLNGSGGNIQLNSTTLITSTGGHSELYIRGGQFIADNSIIDASTAGGSGKTFSGVDVRVNTMTLQNSSRLEVFTSSDNPGESEGQTGISANDLLITGSGSGIFLDTLGAATAGRLFINVENGVTLNDGAVISSSTLGAGGAGRIEINTPELNILNGSSIKANTTSSGSGGSIIISDRSPRDCPAFECSSRPELNNLIINNGSFIQSDTSGIGNAGSILITANGTVAIGDDADINPGSAIASNSLGAGSGSAGSIAITAQQINMAGDGRISAATESNDTTNSIADVSITATNNLNVRSGTLISTNTSGDVAAGAITIDTASLNNAGTISASTSSNGAAGVITLKGGTANIDGGTVSSSTSAAGQGGSIVTALTNLNVTNGGELRTNTTGSGTGGNIDILVTDTALIRGTDSGLRSETLGGSGTGGSITVKAPTIRVDRGGTVSAVSTGTGDAGDIKLLASDSLFLDQANIATSSLNAAGGSIKLYAPNFLHINESQITAEANGVSPGNDGGNISIDPILLLISSSNIVASANAGNGGNINIIADNMIISPDTVIDASSNTGIDGDVAIETPNQYLGTDAEQETPFLDISGLIRNSCVAEQRQRSSFTTEERNYFYFNPDSYLPSAIDGVIKKKRKKREHQAMLAM